MGFDHVSDDDFARVTIAQLFASHPKLDPSGTSWLPFPFWTLGAALAVFGRSLDVARVVSIVLTSAAATLPYLALTSGVPSTGASRVRALGATAFVFLSPWSVWLGASTVPESITASFAAAALIAYGGAATRPSLGFAVAMLAACLSRYEPWPLAAVLAIALALRVRTPGMSSRAPAAVATVLVALGPLAWMAWNASSHGDALHFFHRVSNFKRAIGEGSTSTTEAFLLYPRLLFTSRPDVMIATAGALVLVSRSALLRARWTMPLVAVVAQLLFLAIGNARDGAPAHHPERALLGTFFLLGLFAGDVMLDAMITSWADVGARRRILVAGAIIGVATVANGMRTLRVTPGSSSYEDRAPQIARGRDLRTRNVGHVALTPCAFEHFALVAAYGAPENVDVHPKSGAQVGPHCPVVDEAR